MALKTDLDRLTFLLEAEAELALFGDPSTALGAGEPISAQAVEEQRRYVTNYIGSKQKLIDFIWGFPGTPITAQVKSIPFLLLCCLARAGPYGQPGRRFPGTVSSNSSMPALTLIPQ